MKKFGYGANRDASRIEPESMGSLKIPEKIVVHLVDPQNEPVRLPNVIFGLSLFATRKNDFHLGPFPSDSIGVVTITRALIDAGVRSTYDSGLMDYASVGTCLPKISICLWSQEEVDRALKTREKVWTRLLSGEEERWASIEELRNVYRKANNAQVAAAIEPPCISDVWDGSSTEYGYKFPIKMNL